MQNIFGIDEAGRGAFAGPLVVAGVMVRDGEAVAEKLQDVPVRDSKRLSESQRERVYSAICDRAIPFRTVVISVQSINKKGIGWANTTAIKRLIRSTSSPRPGLVRLTSSNMIIVDGYFPEKAIAVKRMNIRCQVDADATVFPVILAGIVAKVTRDRMMHKLHKQYGWYGWNENKGYGTKKHRQSLKSHGPCPHHRTDFIKKYEKD